MLPDDAAGAGFGGQVKRDLVVEPGALDQARSLVFLMAERAVHHVADAVDEPRLEAAAARKLEFDGFLGDNSDDYIEVVFKIAFLDFFGLDNDVIKRMIENIMNYHQVNVEQMKKIHKNSISKIQKYLQSAMDIK